MVVGLSGPTKVCVLNDEDITRPGDVQAGADGHGYLPQENLCVSQNERGRQYKSGAGNDQTFRAEQKTQLEALLDISPAPCAKNNGDSLSGGERRRTEIAPRAGVTPNSFLLDDLCGVDPIAVGRYTNVVARLKYRNIAS